MKKTEKSNFGGLIIAIIILIYTIALMCFLDKIYEDEIVKLQVENKKLKYNNQELINNIEILNTQLNVLCDCNCGWYEEFYYNYSAEIGAYE